MLRQICLALIMVLILCSASLAASSVWKAQKGGRTIYLGGTCHLLREGDYPLPEEFGRAYAAADLVVFETDIGRLGEPEVQEKLLAEAAYRDGSTIGDHLSPKVYAELRDYCARNGLPLELLGRVKPSLLMVTLTMLELSRQGVASQGVDQYYFGRAKKEGKPVEGLESVDEQLRHLLTIADGDEDAFVSQSLKELRDAREQFDRLAGAWRRGDVPALEEMMLADFRARYPKLHDRLIVARNRAWLGRIDLPAMARRTPFILVGVGHLVGPDGLLAALEKKGYRVVRL